MEKLEELHEKIMKIRVAIQENYPEITHYLEEMPEEDSEAALTKYYDALLEKFRNYVAEHQLQNANRKYKDHHL